MTSKRQFVGERVRLGDVVRVERAPAPTGAKVWLLNLDAVERNTGKVLEKNRVAPDSIGASTVAFTADSILYSKLRPNLNKVVVADEPGLATSEMLPLIAKPRVLDRIYLAHLLRSKAFMNLAISSTAGSKMPRLNKKVLLEASFPIPDLETQQQRVNLLSHIEAAREKVEQQLSRFDALVKSRFVEMFENDDYPLCPLSDLASSMRNGVSPSKTGSYHAKVLTLSAVTQGSFDATAWKEGRFTEEPPADTRVSGDVFYVCRGNGNKHLVGVGDYSSISIDSIVFPDTMIAVKIKQEQVTLPFLKYAWNQPLTRRQIETLAKTTNGTFKINQTTLGNIRIPLPPLPLQQEFAAFAAQVDKSRFVAQQQIEKLQLLYDKLTQDYFG